MRYPGLRLKGGAGPLGEVLEFFIGGCDEFLNSSINLGYEEPTGGNLFSVLNRFDSSRQSTSAG